jgi:hypothetical protein
MNKRARSVTRERKSFAVAASPFNVVKLALGIIIVIGVLLVLVTGKLAANPATQVLLLGSYGVISAVWLVAKTRQVERAHTETSGEKSAINNELEK